jgi:hypothetical protein
MASKRHFEIQAGSIMIDVDSSYDPASGLTLDEHRQIEFDKLKQVPFGQQATPVEPIAEPTPEPVDET